ncbi:hypothetical protein [Paenibacillus sp. GCM10027626]|uniref:hypothetical protein n=1 Tax=Paenibacillus sp. GCM10027626 TaxID=3273411 RepID=UPI00363BC947
MNKKPLFERHHSTPSNSCLIAQGIQPALSRLYGQTEDAMKQHLSMYTVADVLKETLAHASANKC